MCLCNAHEELLYTKYGDCPTKREKKGCPILGTILEERGTSIEIMVLGSVSHHVRLKCFQDHFARTPK